MKYCTGLFYIFFVCSCYNYDSPYPFSFKEKKQINDYVESIDGCIEMLRLLTIEMKELKDLIYNQKQVDENFLKKNYKYIETLEGYNKKLNESILIYRDTLDLSKNKSILIKVASFDIILYETILKARTSLKHIKLIHENYKHNFSVELEQLINKFIILVKDLNNFRFNNLSNTSFQSDAN